MVRGAARIKGTSSSRSPCGTQLPIGRGFGQGLEDLGPVGRRRTSCEIACSKKETSVGGGPRLADHSNQRVCCRASGVRPLLSNLTSALSGLGESSFARTVEVIAAQAANREIPIPGLIVPVHRIAIDDDSRSS